MRINDRPMTGSGQANGLDFLIAVRLIHIHAYAVDTAASVASRAEKSRLLDDLVVATSKISAEMAVPPYLHPLAGLANNNTLIPSVREIARALSSHLTVEQQRVLLVEAATTPSWPKGNSWAVERDMVSAQSASLFMSEVRAEQTAGIRETFELASKRLRQDSKAPGAQATQATVMAALTVASGGAGPAVGTFVGTHFLGLSGAAATSAGLALLGGGSLASGGFGMAGGLHLLHAASLFAKAGGRRAWSHLASMSSDAFVDSVAKLDALVVEYPGLKPEIIAQLERLEVDLRADLKTVQPEDLNARRVRMAGSVLRGLAQPLAIPGVVRDVRTEVSAEERRLARALRVVDFELRHLRSPEWKRQVARLPRIMGVPSASKLLDPY